MWKPESSDYTQSQYIIVAHHNQVMAHHKKSMSLQAHHPLQTNCILMYAGLQLERNYISLIDNPPPDSVTSTTQLQHSHPLQWLHTALIVNYLWGHKDLEGEYTLWQCNCTNYDSICKYLHTCNGMPSFVCTHVHCTSFFHITHYWCSHQWHTNHMTNTH